MMLQDLRNKREEGFTIIEVLIVLAIAGLILLIVLIAVPQLQRNQRNESRRSVLSRITTEINNYTGNNRNAIPTADNDATTGFTVGFRDRYLGEDPGAGFEFYETFKDPGGDDFDLQVTAADINASAVDEDQIYYAESAQCVGESIEIVSPAEPRSFAVAVGLEGGALYCLDNQSN